MSREKSYLEKQIVHRPEKRKPVLGEGAADSRMAKISFKNYLRKIEEDLLAEDDDIFEEEFSLPVSSSQIEELYDKIIDEENIKVAREKDTPEDGAEYFMDLTRKYFVENGIPTDDADEWLTSDYGNQLYEMFYEGLT